MEATDGPTEGGRSRWRVWGLVFSVLRSWGQLLQEERDSVGFHCQALADHGAHDWSVFDPLC